jgi:hypothetical protein
MASMLRQKTFVIWSGILFSQLLLFWTKDQAFCSAVVDTNFYDMEKFYLGLAFCVYIK